jgi:hypothetical protein
VSIVENLETIEVSRSQFIRVDYLLLWSDLDEIKGSLTLCHITYEIVAIGKKAHFTDEATGCKVPDDTSVPVFDEDVISISEQEVIINIVDGVDVVARRLALGVLMANLGLSRTEGKRYAEEKQRNEYCSIHFIDWNI